MKMRHYQILSVLVLFMAVVGRIQAQPIITQQPVSQLNQSPGANVILSVAVDSSAPASLHYQWRRNGVLIPGATNSSFGIDDFQPTNGGAYRVRAIDDTGVAVSDLADVTVGGISNLAGSDSIKGALSLSELSSPIRTSNINAVKEAGTPDIITGDPGGSEIWFRWSLPAGTPNGIITFSTLGSDFDTTLGAYTGSGPGNLVQAPTSINDDDTAGYLNSQISFYAEATNSYLIAVDGFYGAQGNIVLSWAFSPGSLPDFVPSPVSVTSSNGAFVLINIPWQDSSCDWFQNGQLGTNQQGGVLILTSLDDAEVGSYAAQLQNPDGLDDMSEPILVQINTLQDGTTDTNSVAWVKFQASANNSVQQLGQVRKLDGGDSAGFSCSQIFSTVGNADEDGEPVVCNRDGAHPSWYAYVTPSAGSLMVNTAGSSFNTILGVFIGPGNSFTTLTNIACGYTTNRVLDGQPSIYIPKVSSGQTNYIFVEGDSGASGVVHLNIYLGIISMSIVPIQGGVTLSWPSAGGTNLQVSTNLAGAWQPAGLKISTADNTNSVTATNGAVGQFFRLLEPTNIFK